MDSDYDRKFEEMKKYIPFLENMIKRLESTSSAAANPRQAQLDKIRSLRDLLLDQKKRMKMENLLKCEQVLVNLYAKVEQRDTQIGPKSTSTASTTKPSEGNDLEKVRNKLKSVSKSLDEGQETLPEIARANIVEETCTPGSKEPALFQRRPNKNSLSPVRNPPKSPNKAANSTIPKRNYTRVLLSPEPSNRRWESNEKTDNKPLFSRRSPRRSPKRSSPTYNKKERKKSKQGQTKKGKDLNITLNVPEESLNSLNSKDILSRIMNCNDNDVDIETLREAKRQILNELKQTGAKCDDISDLLLKSYKKRGSSKSKKKDEVEEGELSDSESEAISSIYDNFILDDGNANSSKGKGSMTQEKPRKIQICLVINSDKDAVSSDAIHETSNVTQGTAVAVDDFEMYDEKSSSTTKENLQDCEKGNKSKNSSNLEEISNDSLDDGEKEKMKLPANESSGENQVIKCNKGDENKPGNTSEISVETNQPANFYKPLKDEKNSSNSTNESSLEVKEILIDKSLCQSEKDTSTLSSKKDDLPQIASSLKSTESEDKEPVEIPLLHDQSVATQKPKDDVEYEIDILQALKNEILGEPMPGSETPTTPLMHQPKLTKVASAQEIAPKKRISIEKYKKKSASCVPSNTSLFINDPTLSLNDDSSMSSKEDNLRKQSLKLTEKECERFNFPTKLALDDDDYLSDEDLESDFSLNDIYGNLAPKSPDNKEAPSNIKNAPPVIIPVEPVKTGTPSKSDVDMRTLTHNIKTPASSPLEIRKDKPVNNIPNAHVDPRMRRDLNQAADKEHSGLTRPVVPPVMNYPNATTNINPSMTPNRGPLLMTPNMTPSATPNRVPNMTPNRVSNMTPSMAPNMTPSRNSSMTPNARTFDLANHHQLEVDDNNSAHKHVYAPMFSMYDQQERSLVKEQERRPHWDQHEKERRRDSRWGDTSELRDGNLKRDPRSSSVHRETSDHSKTRYGESHNNYDNYNSRFHDRRDNYSRADCPRTPVPSFGRSDAPMTPIHPFGRSDYPPTPSHPFGRSDCPLTPSHPFGRSDCPLTPSHPFGRSDCPLTPSHSFGRPDFLRNEGSMTPSHSFGRIDTPSTPSHPFGRSEPQSDPRSKIRDPRLNRSSDQDHFQQDDTDRIHYGDRKRSSYNNSYRAADSYRNNRELSVGRNERSDYSEYDSHHYSKDQRFRRDSTDSHGTPRDFDDKFRGHSFSGNEYHRKTDSNDMRKGFIRERSIGRGVSTDSRMHPSSSRRFDVRASSVGRTSDTDNRLSVKPDVGGSFTIDTSVRSTFQGFLREDKKQMFDYSFDDRRRRASSVGRTLCRESSVGRSLPNQRDQTCSTAEYFNPNHNQSNFRRARSVGRDILASEKERSFKDLKEDFQNFYKQNNKLKCFSKHDTRDPRRKERSSSLVRIIPSKQGAPEKFTKEIGNIKPYSPRKNNRDPRMRRDLQGSKNKHKYENSRERESKHVGIVYSNDNITKGTILGSGYGVKNYKIPKIKRPVEEQKQLVEEKKEVQKEAKDSKKKEEKHDVSAKKLVVGDDKSKIIKKKVSKVEKVEAKCHGSIKSNPVKSDLEIPIVRVTRMSKKIDSPLPSSNDTPGFKTKKTKKAVIYDSDSDIDQHEPENKDTNKLTKPLKICTEKKLSGVGTGPSSTNFVKSLSKNEENVGGLSHTDTKKSDIENSEITNAEKASNEEDIDDLDTSFGIDDLESFTDNLVSDPVIDNINALIADLDNDLEPSKSIEFSNDKSTLESIGSDKTKVDCSKDLNSVTKVVEKNISVFSESPTKSESVKKSMIDTKINEPVDNKAEKGLESSKLVQTTLKIPLQSTLASNDNIVSTTEINKESICEKKEDNKKPVIEGSSTPDSTDEVVSKKSELDDSLPDSTNETQTDINSLVTSSHDSLKDVNKDNLEVCSSNKEGTSNNSIDNILSILKNKSKLKEIFSMLGGQSNENERIKKKLEKLCEMVSDEDDESVDGHDAKSTLDTTGESSSKADDKDQSVVDEPSTTKDTKEDSDLPEESKLNSNDNNTLVRSDKNEAGAETILKDNTEENADTVLKDNIEESPHTVSKDNTEENDEMDMDENNLQNQTETNATKKKLVRKGKFTRRGRGRSLKTVYPRGAKRITRSATPKVKKPSRELLQLQEDLKEMFISDDVLNATGIRMCRLAKLVDESNPRTKEDASNEPGPVVVLQKFKDMESIDETPPITKIRKKPGPKPKPKPEEPVEKIMKSVKYKPGPKSKTKQIHKSDDEDPYAFESDSISENNESIKSFDKKEQQSSDSENDSLASSQSFGSTDLLVELKKKPKRKRSSWQTGVIKSRNRKKKSELKQSEIPVNDDKLASQTSVNIPDPNCFTDKSYCFYKNVLTYSCRLCIYSGEDIVNHYKQQHPHSEIPLSRLSPEMAKEAIEQCEEINFQAISKIPSEKYVCRFCFKEFGNRRGWKKCILEEFFWHIVSMHTGEYKHSCSCVNVEKCPFNLDIPPPPKDVKGQLIGYICEKCNFTQISLENLKTHVIVRHNDEQTEVYTINLAVMSRKAITALTRRTTIDPEKSRVLRSGRSNQSATEVSDDQSDVTDSDQPSEIESESLAAKRKLSNESETTPDIEKKSNTNMLSKIAFENDDISTEASNSSVNLETVKKEAIVEEIANNKEIMVLKNNLISEICGTDDIYTVDSNTNELPETTTVPEPADINDCAHFKISYTDSGSKEYVCCVNGEDNHYRTALLISMKKHVQLKHFEIWDGYCFLCKVIVTPQGQHKFKECLQHYLDKHMDNFPVIENPVISSEEENQITAPAEVQPSSVKPYINVRPISELISNELEALPPLAVELPTLPKIENVMSLGSPKVAVAPSQASPSYPRVLSEPPKEDKKEYKYEEVQADVMSKKHRVVLDTMMTPPKLMNVFKCAGRYCSFTTDSAEEALVHASAHKRVGGENSLICSYCNFDCSGNAIDLVMHVFKAHGSCNYCCGYCFYRAAASQLVTTHIDRIHRDVPFKVLSAVNVLTTPPTKDTSILPREAVVKYYVCPHACKFKAYTAGKFCDHLVNQHGSELYHNCYVCHTERKKSIHKTAQQLVQHMKVHQLNVYQCTWCMHGADSETGLLLHASHAHPHKQPQAYLRVIQRLEKDGSTQLRVLPLVSFIKNKVKVEVITPAVIGDNAVREAEREADRSIELEKLIGHTTQLIDSIASSPETDAVPPTETESAVTSIMAESEILETPQPSSAAVVAAVDPTPVSQPLATTPPPQEIEPTEQITPKIKPEPGHRTPTKSLPTDVVCLDTDDENSRDSRDYDSIIALSDDETVESPTKVDEERKYKIIPTALLLKCPTCQSCYKTVSGFKRHMNGCFPRDSRWFCSHCGLETTNRDGLVKHYLKDHTDQKCLNVCSECDARFPSMSLAKTHMKCVHSILKYTVRRRENSNKEVEIVVGPATAAVATKRKRSSSTAPETPQKLRRFGPQDVDRLPINPILDESVSCSLCEFKTKVRLNMVRHLQLHAEQQPVPQTAPINPVPHLETNEKHFDKMVNLASSSIVTRAPEKPSRTDTATVALLIPPEAASRYPKYVPDRQRHTCGAKGCSYISVDEAMLRCHWETLHSGSNDFHCVHCPPYQHLDTSKPLTAARIIAHLKMHDSTLYACSSCVYYHYKKQVLEKHLAEVHKGSGRIMVVREEVLSPLTGNTSTLAAPTMDLKPWQCGLCSYKSMLRPEVADHCAKAHQSKMQFKCSYCPFRTSALENVTKHQVNAHSKKSPEIFYYYYREGSIADEADGTPRWMKQRGKFSSTDPEVKSENTEPEAPSGTQTLYQLLAAPSKPLTAPVDLNIVKKEVEDCEMSVEQLMNKYGQVCEPNGLSYKCPLCKVITEDTREAMQFHLYEELKYRKWVCSICSYKAFHKTGLNKHIISEHKGLTQEADGKQLPVDINIEKWVEHILKHQTVSIEKNKENFSKQKILTEKPPPAVPSTSVDKSKTTQESADKYSMKELEQSFGPLGVPSNMMFCCPKCSFMAKEEAVMRDHLEIELSKIRWCCSSCADKFTTYHEAQFHCKSVHASVARPVEAPRAPPARAAWLKAVLHVQRLTMNCQPATADPTPTPATPESTPAPDDLLVVRYEEPVPDLIPIPRPEPDRKPAGEECRYCGLKTRYKHVLRDHMYRHYNLKPFSCALCDFNGYRATVIDHLAKVHKRDYKPEFMRHTTLPSGPPPPKARKIGEPGARADYAPDTTESQPRIPDDPNVGLEFSCNYCNESFNSLNDLKIHHTATHFFVPLKYTSIDKTAILDSENEVGARIATSLKRVARKSTTKLPSQAVAKKSTTKLPYNGSDDEDDEYSYYGTKPPSPSKYENVTTLMSFYNTMVPFTMKKLGEVIKINPSVRVKDFAKE